MTLLTPRAVPTGAPDTLAAGEWVTLATRQGVQVELVLKAGAGAAVAVRPWYYLGGVWRPARADGAAGVGVEPVTADPTKYGGRASGIFLTGPTAVPFCLVLESGSVNDVERAEIGEYFIR